MDNTWKEMLQTNVYDYISNIDYNHPDFSLTEFKKQLGTILGMVPAVKINWNTVETINELARDSGALDYKTVTDKAEKIEIYFTDPDNKPISFIYLF